MLKLQTIVESGRISRPFSYGDRIMLLGSCFADNIGGKMTEAGFKVCVNPFGTLYNPVSICNSIYRLSSGIPFSEADCVEMGAGAGLVCSFSHHTSFARATREGFLANANKALAEASGFFRDADLVIISLGTAWCYSLLSSGEVVSNCLKRNAYEFRRERMETGAAASLLVRMVQRFPDKRFIFTVSPIRHLKDGAHGNKLSKATLLLAADAVCAAFPERTAYFPAYEIMEDELRDYRFYAEDMLHPSSQAVDYIWERFTDFALAPGEKEKLLANEKLFRASRHRPILSTGD